MNEFVNMWKNYVNFSDRTSVRGYWMAFLFVVICGIVVSILGAIIHPILSTIWALAIFLPSLAMQVRRLRDVGRPWFHLFIVLIPLVGAIILIIWLIQPSVPDDGVPQV